MSYELALDELFSRHVKTRLCLPSFFTMTHSSMVCALFMHWGVHRQTAHEAMCTLKQLNPGIRVIYASTANGDDCADVNDKLVHVNKWWTRVNYINQMRHTHPECHTTISLDATASICTSDLESKLWQFKGIIGTNDEHTPMFSPTYAHGKRLPHCFAVVFKQQGSASLMSEWAEQSKYTDDQTALRIALQKTNTARTRLDESFTMAFKSVSKRRFGLQPRFTWLITGAVTLVHSHAGHRKRPMANIDICSIVNKIRAPRMIVSDKEGAYVVLNSTNQCESFMLPYNAQRMCTSPGLLYQSAWG